MNVRELTEQSEKEHLSAYATKSADSRGRVRQERKCDIRTDFQRDRDRIIYSKAFRRLKHKTQVFLSPEGDHYRTRLTHTLEVSQIGRTIARALKLNEDLTEAIALGHDLGHTPFGHMGEAVLNDICPHGFRHNEQSLRVIDVLERDGGLNLTYEVRDGILCHTGSKEAATPEGRLVNLADKIAYINHDIDDAVRGGILTNYDIPAQYLTALGSRHSQRIDTLVKAVIFESQNKNEIKMTADIYEAMMGLRQFMFDNVYINAEPQKEERKAVGIISALYKRFVEKPELVPSSIRKAAHNADEHIMARDYIAGMSDRYAVSLYSEMFIPKFWK